MLFYSLEGDLQHPETVNIVAHHLHPLDVGSATFTEYDFDGEVANYLVEHPELMGYTYGHIHSHQNMGVFFSGTDDDALRESAPAHDYFLSLIVNNRMDTCAKLAFMGEADKSTNYICKVAGKELKYQSRADPVKVVMVMTLDIEAPESLRPAQTFVDIVEALDRKTAQKLTSTSLTPLHKVSDDDYHFSDWDWRKGITEEPTKEDKKTKKSRKKEEARNDLEMKNLFLKCFLGGEGWPEEQSSLLLKSFYQTMPLSGFVDRHVIEAFEDALAASYGITIEAATPTLLADLSAFVLRFLVAQPNHGYAREYNLVTRAFEKLVKKETWETGIDSKV